MRRTLCALMLACAAVSTAGVVRADERNPLTPLVEAATARLQTADSVAAVKWITGARIEDPARVQQVLAAVSTQARSAGVDADPVSRIFSDQIQATEAVEYARFAQWKLDAVAAPGSAPDLPASRSAIDQLTATMVAEIAAHWQLLGSPECVTDRDDAVAAAADAHGLDGLYRQALGFATRSYCRP